LGYFKFCGNIQSLCFTSHDSKSSILAVLSNNLLAGAYLPAEAVENRRIPFTEEAAPVCYRKIDRGSNMVMANPSTGDIFVTGEDKLLKKYAFPEDKLDACDWKMPPKVPSLELPSHSIGTSCWDYSEQFKQFATGGKDGAVTVRNINNMANGNEIKAHTLFTGGVSAIGFSNSRSTIYSAGGDGSFMAWTVGGKPNPNSPIQLDANLGKDVKGMPELERCLPE